MKSIMTLIAGNITLSFMLFSVFGMESAEAQYRGDVNYYGANSRCKVDLVTRRGRVIDTFRGRAPVKRRACRKARRKCQSELSYRHSIGKNPQASCVRSHQRHQLVVTAWVNNRSIHLSAPGVQGIKNQCLNQLNYQGVRRIHSLEVAGYLYNRLGGKRNGGHLRACDIIASHAAQDQFIVGHRGRKRGPVTTLPAPKRGRRGRGI